MISIAFAEQGPLLGGSWVEMLTPFALMFLVFYFLLIRPQQKKAKEHQTFLKNLKKGDEVVTSGGFHGVVHGLTDPIVTLEVDNNTRIRVDRNQIARKVTAKGNS